jgi:NitT/TauT family transport system substrate-binding protein
MDENSTGQSRRDVIRLAAGIAAGALLPLNAHAAASLEIMAPYYKSLVTMAPIAVALEIGSYKKHGVDVTNILTSVGGGTSLRNMIGGGIGYAEIGTPSAILGLRADVPIRLVHNSMRTARDILWVAMPNSGIRSIKGLGGKKIGISAPRSASETLAQMALEKAGMSGKASLVAIGPVGAGLSALENGGIDAALIMEPLWTQREKRYVTAFTLDGLPLMSTNCGVATLDFIKFSPETLRNLIAGRREAVDFLYAHVDEAAAMVSSRYGSTLPADVAPAVIHRMADIQY